MSTFLNTGNYFSIEYYSELRDIFRKECPDAGVEDEVMLSSSLAQRNKYTHALMGHIRDKGSDRLNKKLSFYPKNWIGDAIFIRMLNKGMETPGYLFQRELPRLKKMLKKPPYDYFNLLDSIYNKTQLSEWKTYFNTDVLKDILYIFDQLCDRPFNYIQTLERILEKNKEIIEKDIIDLLREYIWEDQREDAPMILDQIKELLDGIYSVYTYNTNMNKIFKMIQRERKFMELNINPLDWIQIK